MAKAEWGLKRVCPQCATRYYDMKKNPPVCPSCGTSFDPDTLTKSRRHRAAAEEKARKAAPVPEELDDIPVVADEADDVIEDIDELDEEGVDAVVDIEESDDADRS
ncbi:MAG TPA: TIGR02300 family protein [Rhodospirillaceae bacterium]|nr:TIGR02300 family protein [Rhodospirillaceae bacterium]